MVEFGKRLKDECAQHGADWQRHCIDYGALKDLIDLEKRAQGGQPDVGVGDSALAVATDVAHAPCFQFRQALDRQVEMAVLFVLEEQGRIASALEDLARQRAGLADRAGTVPRAARSDLRELHAAYELLGHAVLKLLSFVDLNATAVRKILKKHDKTFEKQHTLTRSYLSASSDSSEDSHLDQLYSEGGLTALVVSLRRAFLELHRIEEELLAARAGGRRHMSPGKAAGRGKRNHRRIQSTPLSLFEAPAQPAFGEEVRVTAAREPLLRLIQLSRDRLRQSGQYVDFVAAQALMFEDADEGLGPTDASSEATAAQRLSGFLNLLSTFLYMTNYYVVAPSLGTYLIKLGSAPSLSGLVIGMTPNAALIATVLYGWWSNHSYKSALVFAAACSLAGNLFYASALHYDSTAFILVGRALNGFGSARSINRRFIADTFTKADRTAASAAFVSAGALGMACGPALSAVCSYFRAAFPADGTLWSLETAPGWIMAVAWTLYLGAVVLCFEEPDRTHIFGDAATATAAPMDGTGEKTHLLANDAARAGGKDAPPSLLSNVSVMTTLWIYFVLKLVLECLMSSCATVTYQLFGWTSGYSGSFLAVLGLLMFPANMVVARLSQRFEDRELIKGSLAAMLCSIIGFALYLPGVYYSVVQYVLFGMCIFISANALEGPNMSLLSKSIPKRWAKGIFNAGFLATEAGTLSRSVGDIWITFAEHYFGAESLFDYLFVPILVLCGASYALIRKNYNKMVDPDDDDDIKKK